MAGNSERRGATRKPGTKKGAQVGTGGHSRKALRGKGPTPKAEDRVYHPAHQRKLAAERRAARQEQRGPARGPAAKARRRGDATEVVAGRNAVLEALRADMPVTCVYIASRLDPDDRTEEILKLASARSLKFVEGSKLELDRLTDHAVHQGIAIQVPPYQYADADDLLDAAASAGEPPLVVALDGVTDPRNLGAVLRSAGAFGAHGVLVPERRAAGMTASAWKVSAGAAARVPVARATNLARELEALKKAGCFVVGLDADGDTEVGDVPFTADPLVLVVGSEGKGLSRLVREACDAVASIPIAATTESLNAAVAGGIALYEVARQRRQA
ncbi:23S rRNA (guanosine(2251)-2'-O)-methyltransferase RlmB [Myceligenerans pegani]|uniref:23S rRNA (Guanosine(2251)-2'-O)-methyltransferase RlmB n=1 Tax=Myceligenerans pegani TaxID=2776917 RepID=A0ABR9MWP7_9MICO|nr:23S rRNA (guanosine(2251)-2'-O)-methyltransferase RlmB [Myceligenerans sp. TRM 65318]MBE1875197.1 23S rRNA (guanosine(2251)-2'-O)-methyltransferase RlmB [Myceligenerans sp. TRM 65318]MBE3017468.1 23S rRNA (guanosine(2251)-2'-O)-methyltransferase RlmB [Myceligenerans sp. TRM 65318]